MATRKPVMNAAALPTRQQWAEYCAQQVALNPTWVPPNQLCVEDLADWHAKKDALARAQQAEMTLRLRVVKWFFPDPEEGANNAQMPDGTKINLTHPISRKVDEASLATFKKLTVRESVQLLAAIGMDPTVMDPDMPVFDAMGIAPDVLLEYKPSLKTTEYRTLTAEQLAIFDRVLEIKPGSPQLKIEFKKDGE